MLKKMSDRMKGILDKSLNISERNWKKPLILVLLVVLIYVITMLNIFWGDFDFLNHALTISSIVFLTWLAVLAVRGIRYVVIKNSIRRYNNHLVVQRINTQMAILVKILTIVIVIIGTALVLMTFPQIRKIGVSILASAGIASVILGFSAQKSLANILSGVQVAFTQSVKIGDVIVVENEWGRVEEITLTRVVMCTSDKRRLIIPINYFNEKIFQNWTVNSSDLLGFVNLELDYTAPIQKIREALDKILEGTEFWDGKVKKLYVTGAKSQTIQIRISVSALDASDSWNLKCHVREKLIEFLQKEHPYCLPKTRVELDTKNSSS